VRRRLEAYTASGERFNASRLRRQVQGAEYELAQLDRLIRGLDRRFTAQWAELDAELSYLPAGAAVHEQRHEITDRATGEPGMIHMHDRCNCVLRHCRIPLCQPVDHLLDRSALIRIHSTDVCTAFISSSTYVTYRSHMSLGPPNVAWPVASATSTRSGVRSHHCSTLGVPATVRISTMPT
jgi:hypothetical protein